jgi:hypothetical protein
MTEPTPAPEAHVKAATQFYITGGTLPRDAISYVPRHADEELFDGLMQGEFCYVLTSRQMGKSSLMVRTAARLREQGVTVVVLDLTALGQNLTAEQWYDGLLNLVGRQLRLEDELEDFWLEHDRLGPLQRWMRAVREVVLTHISGPLVIFVDEIDTVRSLPFSTDEFFAAIRESYNRRAEEPGLRHLTFCLLGVATPSDLIRDTHTTPFNIGRRIELSDFTNQEAAILADGLRRNQNRNLFLLKKVMHWTGGHPYLTQRFCQVVAADSSVQSGQDIDAVCKALFLAPQARERDDNLLFVRDRLLRSEGDVAGALDLYGDIWHKKRVPFDDTNQLHDNLRLAGIVRIYQNYLKVRNRIYDHVFNRHWVSTHMPDAELRRQRRAFRLGLLRASGVFALVLITGRCPLRPLSYTHLPAPNSNERTW